MGWVIWGGCGRLSKGGWVSGCVVQHYRTNWEHYEHTSETHGLPKFQFSEGCNGVGLGCFFDKQKFSRASGNRPNVPEKFHGAKRTLAMNGNGFLIHPSKNVLRNSKKILVIASLAYWVSRIQCGYIAAHLFVRMLWDGAVSWAGGGVSESLWWASSRRQWNRLRFKGEVRTPTSNMFGKCRENFSVDLQNSMGNTVQEYAWPNCNGFARGKGSTYTVRTDWTCFPHETNEKTLTLLFA